MKPKNVPGFVCWFECPQEHTNDSPSYSMHDVHLERCRIWLPTEPNTEPRCEVRNDSSLADPQNIPFGRFEERIVGRVYYDNEPKHAVYGCFLYAEGPGMVALAGAHSLKLSTACAVRLHHAYTEYLVRIGVYPNEADFTMLSHLRTR